jgi:hypothetical protein
MDLRRYEYKALDPSKREVRLVKLHSAFFRDSEIRCSLLYMSLDDSPSYQALSYVWGDQGDKVRIWVDEREFRVTRSLFSAMEQLRPKFLDTVFWIDAICINQDDVVELSSQVPLMRSIYSSAKKTIVWMGKTNTTMEKAFKYFEDLWETSTRYEEDPGFPGVCVQRHPRLLSRESCDLIISFFENEWWKRVWTYQECILSNYVDLVCGDASLDWTTFEQAWEPLRTLGSDLTFASRWMNWAVLADPEEGIEVIGGGPLGSARSLVPLEEDQVMRLGEVMAAAPHLHVHQRRLKHILLVASIAGFKVEPRPPRDWVFSLLEWTTLKPRLTAEELALNLDDFNMPDRVKRFHTWMKSEAPFDSRYRNQSSTTVGLLLEIHKVGIERLVLYGMEKRCANPRDKIYGLLGADTARYVDVDVDYSRTVSDIYSDFIRRVAVQKRELRLLSVAGLTKRGLDAPQNLPSWVPNFNESQAVPRFDRMHYDTDFAIRVPPSVASFSDDLKYMTTQALWLSTVVGLSAPGPARDETDSARLADFLTTWEAFVARHYHPIAPSALPWRQVLYRTVIADDTESIMPHGDELKVFQTRAVDFFALMATASATKRRTMSRDEINQRLHDKAGRSASPFLEYFAWWLHSTPNARADLEAFREQFLGLHTWASLQWSFDQSISLGGNASTKAELLSNILSVCPGKRLFHTTDGYVGISSAGLRIDDIVCAIPGSYALIIIRKKDNFYQLISDCYMCGRSAGQSFQQTESEHNSFREIVLI